jgi:hypothetical protein
MGLFVMEEIWKDVVGYEGLYQVSNLGNIFSLQSKRLMKKNVNNRGYERVTLKGKQVSLHRIVCIAFIKNEENKLVVNHKNGIKTDNNINNLEWATCRENSMHYHSSNPIKEIKLKTCIRYEKWITINGKNRRIGRFKSPEEAMLAYQNKLKSIDLF